MDTSKKVHLILTVFVLMVSLSSTSAWAQTDQETIEFTGAYNDLEPAQKRLIDDWFERFNQVMDKNMEAEEGFNLLSLSIKTTYQAVSHALMTSELTDKNGNSLGTALDLVAHVETVKGKVKGAGGDQQFRMYCSVKDGTRDILVQSEEFKKGHDNTVYHKGYPTSYRQQGGVPSIQFSISKDGKRADIDVDYRSSKFPVALLNGHLTSSNSDVRAGNNFDKHTNRWSGLQNWWADWFSIPFVQEDSLTDEDKSIVIPADPPKGRGDIHEAAYDFLKLWMVDKQSEVSMSYISNRAFQCIQAEIEGSLDIGMIPFQILVGMRKTAENLGQISNINDAVQGIRMFDPEIRVVQHPHHETFVLYDVPESRAFQFECANRGLPENEVPKGSKTKYGKYYGSVFFVKVPGGQGETLALLWAKEKGYWKIISWEAEPASDDSEVPDLRTAIAAGEITRVQGKPQQVSAAHEFLEAWFIKKDYDQALSFFADECFECVNLFLQEGEQPVEGLEALKPRLRLGLKRTAEAFGSYTQLSDVMSGFEPVNPDSHIVSHSRESDFTLLSIPDYLAGNYGCAYRLSGGDLLSAPEKPSYGNHYVLGFQTKTFTGEPAILFTLWARRSGDWKIVSFHIERP